MIFELVIVGLLGVITILLFCILNKDLCLQYCSVRSRILHRLPSWLRPLVFPPGNTKGIQTLSSYRWKLQQKRYQDLGTEEGVYEWDTRDVQTATDFWLPPVGESRDPVNYGQPDLYRGHRLNTRPIFRTARLPTDSVPEVPEPTASTVVRQGIIPFSGRPTRLSNDVD